MIIGVGIDIIEVERVLAKIDRDKGFKEQVFSPREIAFCESRGTRGEHYAGRFAAKEAFLKATGLGLTLGYQLTDIEVVHDPLGKPGLHLLGTMKSKAEQHHWNNIHVSISHVKSMATAIVIIEG